MNTSVFIVDDHELVRRGLAALLADEQDMHVVGQAGTVVEALALVPEQLPDVAVLDVRLPDGDGVQLCRDLQLRCPEVRCLMLTPFVDHDAVAPDIVDAAIAAGAAGVVPKHVAGSELTSAIRIVGAGGRLPQEAKPEQPRDPLHTLTTRERSVLRLIGEGLTNRQIAERLNLAEKTVKNYVSSVLGKLGLRRRTQAAVLAAEVRHRL
ncbi:DNA-binding NarL/FixJ family response regulator [Kibdelosporangium banguiense]|uniref:DNA-binding NarL/FixJ family response regulator n=1 Tax=Kibdelosporangium banguiense TaxID=1365924 RepID=A0ABS4T6Z8_9PSEU|nr:response regulator transcription factor [Kibdelosporangium banguiense]MBP2320185.1 DNA-binding NarL/FixJ family response regulator [Kibdelosporangium banguiense]